MHVLRGETEKSVRPNMIHHSSRGMFAIRKGEWKYIDGLGSGGFSEPAVLEPEPGKPSGQLYHLAKDSMETENLFSENPDKVKELKQVLSEKIKLVEEVY